MDKSTEVSGDAPPSKRRRVKNACSFCRERKLKCDNDSPRCSNCKAYDRACNYVLGTGKPRPTKSRIKQLEDDNRRLQERLHSPASLENGSPQAQQPEPSDLQNFSAQSQVAPRIVDNLRDNSAILKEPTYYGSTSTLFEDVHDPKSTDQSRHVPRMSADWIQKGLLAEATRQRQLETINYNSGKLDFDGIDPDLGMHLLSLHWTRQHHSFLVTYRPAFMRDMANNGPYFSKLLLNAICFGAAKFSPRLEVRRDPDDVRTAGWRYRKRVKELLGDSLDKSNITTIQALLVMTNSLFALGDERSAAWLYAGIALRMIVDLGMHVDLEESSRSQRLSDEDLEIRRRVFWGAFVIDKIQSLYQGRPPSLQHFDTRVPTTFFDTYEEFENWTPFAYSTVATQYPGSPAYSISTFTELCKLSTILNRILNEMYSERHRRRTGSELIELQNALHQEMESWREALPQHLDFDPLKTGGVAPPPHVLSLLTLYNVLLIILHRPFVSEGHLHTNDTSIATKSFSVCSDAASVIIHLVRVYDRDFSIRRAPYLIAYAVYVAATIHVRVAAQMQPTSLSHSLLKTCLDFFDENTETNWAVKRAKWVIINLMKRMNIQIAQNESLGQLESQLEAPIPTSNQNFRASQPENITEHNILDAPTETDFSMAGNSLLDDIDIDQVIQSFHSNRIVNSHRSHPLARIEADDDPTSKPTNTQNQGDMNTNHEPNTRGDIFSEFTFNDELFGFNASPGEYFWQFDIPYEGAT